MDIRQAKQLAKDETTSSKVLANLVEKYSDILNLELMGELTGDEYSGLFHCILSNPNTPSNILKKYFIDFPAPVLSNPAIHLILLEQPDFFNAIASPYRLRFFDNKELPTWFFELAKDYPNLHVRSAVAIGKSTPIHILEKLCTDKEAIVRSSVYFNSRCPAHIKDILNEILKKDDWLEIPF